MITFILVHAVDFSTGKAVIGKCHIIDKREEVMAASWSERIREIAEKNRIEELNK